jgi:putative tricarboxylic transport membrane protein
MVGAYVLNNSSFDLWAAVVIGIIGLLFRKFGYPVTPLILGVILGPMAEQEFRRALQSAAGDWTVLVSTPFTISIYVLLALVLIVPQVLRRVRSKQQA